MKTLNIITCVCAAVVGISMFLPVYETLISETEIQGQIGRGISGIYSTGDAYISVHTGFGSFYAMGSCFVTFLLTLGILFLPRENSIPIISVIVYISSLILVRLGMISFGKPSGDTMLIGFYLLLASQTILIVLSFYKIRKLNESDKYTR